MIEILIIIAVLLGYWFFLIYVNSRVQNFLKIIRQYPELYKKAGEPSDTYFFWEFIRLHYKFAIFLYKNKEVPKPLKFNLKEYKSIRNLAQVALFLELVRGLFIISIFIFHQFNVI